MLMPLVRNATDVIASGGAPWQFMESRNPTGCCHP
jgi:hypothetical protein